MSVAGVRRLVTPGRERLADLPAVRVGPPGGGARAPLVVLPGLNDPLHGVADSRWFPRVAARYCRRYADRRSVYYVGQSRSVAASTERIAAGYRPALAAVAERHDRPPALLGLSMGGFLASEVAAARPGLVDRLVLGLAADCVDRASGRELLREWDDHAAAGRWGAIYRSASGVVARGAARLAMQVAGTVFDRLRDPRSPAAFRRAVQACLDHDGRAALSAVADAGVPTLVVGGTGDPFFTDAGLDSAARLADGRRVRLRGAAHDAVLAGGAFDRVVRRFLAGTDAGE